jgi:SAM-dependent methyltransferase
MTIRPTTAPRWVSSFYDRKGQVWGPSGVLGHHRERAAAIERFGRISHGRVLEIGAGSGGSAVATAELGYRVVALELSSVRAGFASDLTQGRADLTIEVLEADFMTVELSEKFDVVTCWNGFGVGSDADQRQLLKRIRQDWLVDDGVAILDIFNPVGWSRLAGESSIDEETGLRTAVDFDAVENRLVDNWWFDGDARPPMAQSIRCYSPPDFRLLLESTGLRLADVEVDGIPLTEVTPGIDGPMANAWGYRVLLTRN